MAIVAVWGPPRSGKTTLAIDLAHALSEKGLSVCLVSTEKYSELSAKMKLHIKPEKSIYAAGRTQESIKNIVHPAGELLYVLAPPFEADVFDEELSPEQSKNLFEQSNLVFDAVIADCTARGESSLAAWGLSLAEKVILLSGGTVSAALWYSAFQKAVSTISEKSILTCNMVYDSFGYEKLCKLISMKPKAWIANYPNAENIQLERKTLYGSNGKYGKKYTDSIDKLCNKLTGGEEA